MTTPLLSTPILFNAAQLRFNQALTSQITSLANEAFMRSKSPDWDKWDNTRVRFPTVESYLDMLDAKTIVALIFDRNAQSFDSVSNGVHERERKKKEQGKVIACAAAVPWKGGWKKEGAETEDGWEIKAVCIDGDVRYLKKGLAVQVMKALEDELVVRVKEQRSSRFTNGVKNGSVDGKGSVTLWILTAECINGAYWRRRGYREIRRSREGDGTWGCKTSFDLVVFSKDVEYEV
ncbi:hypothetical protein EK21DRAFT_94039 [Setomelanomma holmii]|uniref:Uncharacterized protein n=1 Tax=Setomelanomma holmii TaxID=210430 RepID=A0A9P4H0J9_9PLEO|nr:hypothetical protein EK21DRAFT_94039 [Setomelanomma holmii]